ncbi:MAG TPA: serine/threonine-protein kinase [Ktedonobacteraceae bacterium]|nr:serine/threonine-protein kinase [Ktedonobacteraceae bacterium]
MNAEALIGTVLGNCTLQQLIGQGGMGAVYLAQQERPRRQVAVKVLMPVTALKPHQLSAFLERFRRETDAAASLEHPNIMPVYEYGERGGLAFLVMPYISGGTLRDVLEREGQLSFNSAVNYLEQMAAALDFAHARGVIHRDIKPANMLLTSDGRLLLTDFGLVKLLSDHQSEQMRLTGAGAPVGTPDYMSPEQVIGAEVDGRADQYSLGVVLFQMLTGTTPFQGETPMQIASQQLHMQPPSPRSLRPDLSEAAERVLLRAMAKRPDQRFHTAQEFASAFRAALVEQPRTSSLGISAKRNGLLSNAAGNARKGGLFDPQWQSTGTMAALEGSQVPFTTSPLAAQAPTASLAAGPEPKPGGTGLLSRTGVFPLLGQHENTSPRLAAIDNQANAGTTTGLFSTGHMMAATGSQQAMFDQAAAPGFSADTSAQQLPFGQPANAQSPFFTQTGTLQQPFAASNLQQLSPALQQSTTSSLTLLNTEQRNGNTIKLTGPVKVVQVPVAPGQYVTGLLPVQKEDPISEPSIKRVSKKQKILIAAALFVLLVGGLGGGIFLMHSQHPSSPQATTQSTPNIAATSMAQATEAAQNNILFSDPLQQNIHNFQIDGQHFFKNNAYHIISSGGTAVIIQENFPETSLSYQLTMEEINGDDQNPTNTFGMILRYNNQTVKGKAVTTFYTFEIVDESGNYQYGFYKYDSSKAANGGSPWQQIGKLIKAGKELHGGHGPNAVNTLKVSINNGTYTLFVNGQQVGTEKDTSLQGGSMGMLVNLKGTEVAFSNMLITRS